MPTILSRPHCGNSLWPTDAIYGNIKMITKTSDNRPQAISHKIPQPTTNEISFNSLKITFQANFSDWRLMYLWNCLQISLDFGDGDSTLPQVMTILSGLWLPVEPQGGLSWEFSIDCVFELVWVNWHASMSAMF